MLSGHKKKKKKEADQIKAPEVSFLHETSEEKKKIHYQSR